MLQYAKMPLTFTVSNGGSFFWPTLSSACKPKIVSTIYYMSGSNWNNQERDELHLTGTLSDKETLMNELKKFILQVFIMNPANNIDMQALLKCE